ncbi:hypothetical protein BZG36_05113 [Bifiguratus adelaidae]|uniref:Major facilitator superfamily (MFS) profile domain-containing protein n=1 Tax=Bifiguratus adelaidae TaxID=1938954 RepID=A0A261XWF2_9FUNG|nr:hypothetical protein BZG36_05113 [Bifiguratus adelaidae]
MGVGHWSLLGRRSNHQGWSHHPQIENELGGGQQTYMQNLEYKFCQVSLTIPFTFNDGGQGGNYATGTGSVDIYGSDSYPLGFNCGNPTRWPSNVPTYFRSFYAHLNLDEPYFLAEFQGGSFDPWGGVGYADCAELVNEQFAKVYYKNNYAQGITMQSLYMTYGGTSWGALAAPVVYTSYDYGAAISEPRMLTTKYYELKLQATFLNTAKPILTTEYFAGNTSNGAIVDSVLQSVGSSNAQFHVLRQSTTSSTTKQTFTVNINITEGEFTIPQLPGTYVTLNGRDSKILPAGYNTSYHRILYSTSELFSHSTVGSREVAVVYAYPGEYGEIALGGFTSKSKPKAQAYSGNITSNATETYIQINYQHSGIIPVVVSAPGTPDLLLYVADYYHAALFWAPETSPGNRVFVYGPWLVRNAKLSGSDLYLRGGVNETTSIEVAAPSYVNVDPINSILDADTYGYHVGSIWYRGEFTGSACIKGMTLSTQGGNGYGYSVWVNGEFLGGYSGTGASNTKYFNFTSIDNSTNVVSLLIFTTGHDKSEGGNFYNYRGLGSADLIGSQNKITWKVQGNNGGEDILDTVRGPLNEGGLYGERAGWHLPGFPIPSDWATVTLPYNFATPQTHHATNIALSCSSTDDNSVVMVTNDLGPQTLFYVPEGILNYAGSNTIAVAVMSLDSSAVTAPKITLSTIDVTTTDIEVSLVDSLRYTPRAGYGSGTIPSKPPAPSQSSIPTSQNSTAAGCPYTGIVDTSLTYTITVGGVTGCGTVYNYLSGYICDNNYPYGQNGVDFWSADDGSGRQRWNFVEVPGKTNTCNVIVNGRAGCNYTYLSSVPCTGSNNTVELWNEDDESGLQQWTVSPAGNGYNFVMTSGRAGCYDYLSAWPCSTSNLATMYSEDDGSGRQEFVLTPVHAARNLSSAIRLEFLHHTAEVSADIFSVQDHTYDLALLARVSNSEDLKEETSKIYQSVNLDSKFHLKMMEQFDEEQLVYIHTSKVFNSKTRKFESSKQVIVVKGNIIVDIISGDVATTSKGVHIDLTKYTVLPGFVDVHTHVFLHPYVEASWDHQLLQETSIERIARAINHARVTIMAGFTTIRDLGTEGMDDGDVHIRNLIEEGIIPGPRMFVATQAITPTGTYGPKPTHEIGDSVQRYGWAQKVPPHGTMVADGVEGMRKVVRFQLGLGADLIKLYGDYNRRSGHPRVEGRESGEKTPMWTDEEMEIAIKEATRANIPVAVHTKWPKGILQATRAGAVSIEHGTSADEACFEEMKKRGTYWIPTLAAWEEFQRTNGGSNPGEWGLVQNTFKIARKVGVKIAIGGDTGCYTHGENAREMELMVNVLGVPVEEVLSMATIEGWKVCKALDTTEDSPAEYKFGYIGPNWLADIIAIEGDLEQNFSAAVSQSSVKFVMKEGKVYKQPASSTKSDITPPSPADGITDLDENEKAVVATKVLDNEKAAKKLSQPEPPELIRNMSPEHRERLEKSLRRKLDFHILPLVILMYLMNALDRNNIAAAKLGTLMQDLGLTSTQYSTAVAMPFAGLPIMQIPSNLYMNKLGKPGYYLPTIMIMWGIISTCNAAVTSYAGIVVCRFMLGFVESGYYGGCLYYLSCWYTRKELGARYALLYSGNMISGAFSGLIAAGIMSGMQGVRGLASWRWLYIIEGIATIVVAFCAYFILPNLPRTTSWLTEEERQLATWRLIEDIGEDDWIDRKHQSFLSGLKLALTDVKTYVLALMVAANLASGAVINFFPTVVSTLGFSQTVTLLLTAPPYALGTMMLLLNAWHADRTGERYFHVILPQFVAIAAFIIAVSTMSSAARYIAMMLMIPGCYAGYVVMLSWASNTLPRPPSKRAAALAIINGVSNTSSIWTSYMYTSSAAPQFVDAFVVNIAMAVLSILLATLLRFMLVRLNKKLDEGQLPEVVGEGQLDKDGVPIEHPPEKAEQCRQALREALEAGNAILSNGGHAIDAVEAAVKSLEDCPLFNAGRGAVFSDKGENVLEASIMTSHPPNDSVSPSRKGAAATILRHVKNPISLAKAIYLDEKIPHLFMSGETAEKIAKEHGLEIVEQSYFYTEQRWREHIENLPVEKGASRGTVGATAIDVFGHIATATSTGGMNNKIDGRIGDSPVLGAGTWADENVGVSGTGDGEYYIRTAAAHHVASRMKFLRSSLDEAVNAAMQAIDELGGKGGLISVDKYGNHCFAMNSEGMYRGYIRSNDGIPRVAIFADEDES